MKLSLRVFLSLSLVAFVCSPRAVRAESQGGDYKGITDPFGDPTNYEFAEDEKEDKEFFHLGRYLMLGVDLGGAVFTGGLGGSVNPGPYVGGRLQYFFDRQLCLELAGHYSNHLDQVRLQNGQGGGADIDTNVIPITMGFRYYFDIKNAPKAIAVANPYLAVGGGVILRQLSVIFATPSGALNIQPLSTTSFAAYGGAGVEFAIYHRHVYLGLDLRFYYVFWPDANSTFSGSAQLPAGSRSGQYFTPAATLSYNF